MKLRNARLCINCDEVYESEGIYARCPACGSETFRLICEWIPTVAEFERWVNERNKIAGGLMRMDETVIGQGGEAATSTAPAPANAGGERI